jgi:5-methylcytosine-specific restriction endonuclease McrA
MKTCTKCLVEQTLAGFHKDASRKDGLRNQCKVCVAVYMQKNYTANRDHIIKKANVWVEANRDKHNAKCNLWAKNNPAKVNARTARRHASKIKATPACVRTNPDFQWMIAEAYALAKLREKMLGGAWEVDHIVPLRGKMVSGLHAPWNLQVVQLQVNRRKSNHFQVST